MRWIKLAGVTIGVVVAVFVALVLGIAAHLAFGDPDWVKAALASAVRERWQRTLTIEGPVSMSFWPELGVSINKATLSEFKDNAPFAVVRAVRGSVALGPLLSRRLVVTALSLDGVDVTLVRHSDGTLNIADLLAALANPAVPGEPATATVPWRFAMAGARVTDARLTWRDEGRHTTLGLAAPNVDIGTDDLRIARLALDLESRIGETRLAARLATPVTVTLATRRLDARGIEGRLDIDHPKLPTRPVSLPIGGQIGVGSTTAAGTLSARLDDSPVKLAFDATRLSPLALTFDLDIDHVNLDRYLARNKSDDDARLDLSAFKDMDMRGNIRIGRLRLGNITASDVTLAFDAAAGALDLKPPAMSAGRVRPDDGRPRGRPAGR